MNKLLPLLPILLFIGCKREPDASLPFNFNRPDEVIKLPKILHEISGITFYRKNEIACVQDEKGVIFFYDIKKDKIRNTVTFAADKDYEGIANIGDTLFVLRSNGIIFRVDAVKEDVITETYHTFLSRQNNCEGLCYDHTRNCLLVACKGKPEKGTAPRGTKAVYRFDPAAGTLDERPVYLVDPDSVLVKLEAAEPKNLFDRLFSRHEATPASFFEPSDLAIDPVTHDIYILSSVGKIFLALRYDGSIKFAVRLDPRLYRQPEGITFSRDGNLLISDEGKGGRANLILLKRNTR